MSEPPAESRAAEAGRLLAQLRRLHEVGLSLSAEKSLDVLFERILDAAMQLTGAEAGTIYVLDEHRRALRWAVVRNDRLGLRLGGSSGNAVEQAPIELCDEDHEENRHLVAVFAALTGELVDLPNIDEAAEFDFAGTRAFDEATGYRSVSFLTVPMVEPDGTVVGVLQLINARGGDGEIGPFQPESVPAVRSLASQAAVVLDNRDEAERARGLADRMRRVNEIGVALSAESDIDVLLEQILVAAKSLTSADGGTIYLVDSEHSRLDFALVRNDTLGIALGGTTGNVVHFPPVPLADDAGAPNHRNVAAHVALTRETVDIVDAYRVEGFDFSGTKAFDAETGYRSRAFLTVPLCDHEGELLGVLQLLNPTEGRSGEPRPFGDDDRRLVESLASQAAVALTNRKLIQDLKNLFDAIIRSLATAIDRKSPYTGGHCQRVPVLTLMLADAASNVSDGPLAGFSMTDDERYELGVAAWLHDCGKVATPEYVVDKSTKLETIHDRLAEVETRFEVLERDAVIASLRRRLEAHGLPTEQEDDTVLQEELRALRSERAFIANCNVGGERMTAEDQSRVADIARRRWVLGGVPRPMLSEDEVTNLQIARGTLTEAERQIINDHVVVSIEMLEELPYPKNLRNVPEYAGGHHERVDGRGYPNGLTRDEMSWQARMMAIADIFEALTAPDRPYRRPNKLSKALFILGKMTEEGHVDPDLFDVFVRERVYLAYAHEHLAPEQIDDIDIAQLSGHRG